MLAYVFWHQPAPGIESDDYESRLQAFHDRMQSDPPAGFLESAAFRVSGLPWLDGPGYEDWYLVDGWAAVGVLNDSAVDAHHAPDHDAVAVHAGAGAGAIYRHIAGELHLADSGRADWSHKRPEAGPEPAEEALWQRQLVLGPAPEFCLLRRGSNRVSVVSGSARI